MPEPTDPSQSPNSEPAFTEGQTKLIAEIVNHAVSSHMKRASKDQPDLAKLVADAVKAAVPAPTPTDEESSEKKRGNKPDPQVSALQAKIDELTKNYAQAEEARKNAESTSRHNQARSELKSALSGKVRADAVDAVAYQLYDFQKRVELDENGKPFIKIAKQIAPGMSEDVLMPLTDGLDFWTKSPDAQPWLPAPSAGPSAQQPRGSRFPTQGSNQMPKYEKPATTDAEKIRRAAEKQAYYESLMRK